MSRSGYHDAFGGDREERWGHIRWRGVVASATRGKRGQKLLTDLRDALDAMPVKRLITSELKTERGVCALGALGEQRCMDMSKIDAHDYSTVAGAFDIAAPLAQEIMYMNDEGVMGYTPEARWKQMRHWVDKQIKKTIPNPTP